MICKMITHLAAAAALLCSVTSQACVLDGPKPIPWRTVDNIAPAGSINSNILDFAKWLRMQLGKGVFTLTAGHPIDIPLVPRTYGVIMPRSFLRF